MRRLLASLLLCATPSWAEQPVLRFAIAESWSMPLIRIEQGQPVEGILYDLMQSAAREAGVRPEYHVLARLRMQQAMEDGDIDVRCHLATNWLIERPGEYIWSVPLMVQRDLLVSRAGLLDPVDASRLPAQAIGTVLGYSYPTLQPLFSRGQLHREDSRSQQLALQKLQAGRYQYAVSNELSLQWFNRQLPAEAQLQSRALLDEQNLGCVVRSDPSRPPQALLRALVRIKQSGEMERIVQHYAAPTSPAPMVSGSHQ